MNIALAYHKGDRDQAVRWMNRVKDLGGLGKHTLYTIAAFDCEPIEGILESVRLPDDEKISGEWNSSELARSAAAPNSMIRAFAWYFYLQKLGPWLFVEPDSVPMKPGWHDILEAEYIRGGKPFMGARVLIQGVPEHCTGIMIAPGNSLELAPTLVMRTNWVSGGNEYELAFDVAAAKEIIPIVHWTNLIQHNFRHPGFKDKAEIDATIRPETVLFHSDKKGTILKILAGESPSEQLSCAEAGNNDAPGGALLSTEAPSAHESLNGADELLLNTTFEATLPETESCISRLNDLGPSKDTRASLIRDTISILRQLSDTPSRKGVVQRELKRQKIVR